MQEDAILVQKTLDGDEQAFHRLIMKYYNKIYALILSWVKNPEDAKDLVQEVFLEAYLDLGSLRHHEQFRIWLQQIARHQCQDWLRKEKTYIQLDENLICETPLADETLILQETLAKVMKAIDELPKSESQLLKERYLDDDSYDEMETRHGLSHSILAMRLFRAREKVRQRVEKLLASIGIFSWQDALEKMLLGGVEAMKISAKVKIIAIGVGAVLILGGAGVILWHHQTTQEEFATNINQTTQQINTVSLAKNTSVNKLLPTKKPIDKPKEDARDDKAIEQTISQKEEIAQKIEKPEPKTETKKEDNVKSKPTPEEQERIDFVAAGAKELPVLVEQWKDVMAKWRSLDTRYGTQYSEEKAKETDSLAEERMKIEYRFQYLAMSYHGLYAQEGAIYYPEGWIGQLGKQIGIVFGRTPYSPPTADNPGSH
jgi:RNA polymerase sigma factor (sigma-70 family)